MVYLTALLLAQTVQRGILGLLMKSDLRSIWKTGRVLFADTMQTYSLSDWGKTLKNFDQDDMPFGEICRVT